MNRLKLIKRNMYGRAKFDLLRLRVLHHPGKKEGSQDAKAGTDHQRRRGRAKKLRVGENTLNSQHTIFGISEDALDPIICRFVPYVLPQSVNIGDLNSYETTRNKTKARLFRTFLIYSSLRRIR